MNFIIKIPYLDKSEYYNVHESQLYQFEQFTIVDGTKRLNKKQHNFRMFQILKKKPSIH